MRVLDFAANAGILSDDARLRQQQCTLVYVHTGDASGIRTEVLRTISVRQANQSMSTQNGARVRVLG
jgi:hypothetical protein